jgi:hypothetical protein
MIVMMRMIIMMIMTINDHDDACLDNDGDDDDV